MGYAGSKKFVPRRGKARAFRRKVSSKKGRSSKGNLERFVQRTVRARMSELKRGPPRSLAVRLTPSIIERTGGSPSVRCMHQWTAYAGGAGKYGLLPVSELIPSQRPPLVPADDSFRSYNSVKVKGVSLRMSVNFAEGVRLRVFMLRNAARRGSEPSVANRPHLSSSELKSPDAMEDVKGEMVRPSGPPSNVIYGVMSKEELMGDGKGTIRNLGLHDGPFAVCGQEDGDVDWHSPDSTALMSRFTKSEGGPIGKMYVKVNSGQERKCGKSFSKIFSATSLSRTPGFAGQNTGLEGWIGTQNVQLEFFWRLNHRERFRDANGSLSVNERPSEIFVGFDSPCMLEGGSSLGDIPSGAIMGMDMEVYYE